MKYLLDTCVISELIKKSPDKKVTSWISDIDETELFISVITIGELYKGIKKLPESAKKKFLYSWVTDDLQTRFEKRILDFDTKSAQIWGRILAESEKNGRTLPVVDAMIASIGIANQITVVTRNIKDMESSGAQPLNPWLA